MMRAHRTKVAFVKTSVRASLRSPNERDQGSHPRLASALGDTGEEVKGDMQRADQADEVDVGQLAADEVAEEEPELLAAAHQREVRRRRGGEQLLEAPRYLELGLKLRVAG